MAAPNQGAERGSRFNDWLITPTFGPNGPAATPDSLPFPAYDFPKLAQLTQNLRRQYENPGRGPRWRPLQLPMADFIYLKGLVTNLRNTVRPEGSQYQQQANPMNFEMFLLLIVRLKGFSREHQLHEFYKIVTVMEDFSNIEECLITQYKHGQELYILLDILDHTFEDWLYHLLKKTEGLGTYSWNKQFAVYREELRLRFTQFTRTTKWPGHEARINRCLAPNTKAVTTQKRTEAALSVPNRASRFYRTMRDEFMFTCHLVGTEIPARYTLTFQFIESLGSTICDSRVTLNSVMSLIALMFPEHSTNTALIVALLRFYCKTTSEIEANEVVQLMIAGYKYSQATPKESKAKKAEGPKIVTTAEIEALANPEIVKAVHEADKKDQSKSKKAAPSSKEAPKEEPKEESKKGTKSKSRPSTGTEANVSKAMAEQFGKVSDLVSKYSSPVAKILSAADEEFFKKIEKNISGLDPVVSGALLYTAHALRKGIAIEGWNGFARSLAWHSRNAIPGTKPKSGRPKMNPLEMIRNLEVYPAIRGEILLANGPKIMRALQVVFTYGMGRALDTLLNGPSALTEEEQAAAKEDDEDESEEIKEKTSETLSSELKNQRDFFFSKNAK